MSDQYLRVSDPGDDVAQDPHAGDVRDVADHVVQ